MKTGIELVTAATGVAMLFVATLATLWNGHRSISEYGLIWETLVAGAGCIGMVLFCGVVALIAAKAQPGGQPAIMSTAVGCFVGCVAMIVLWLPIFTAAGMLVERFTDYTS